MNHRGTETQRRERQRRRKIAKEARKPGKEQPF
jgi:hypothetical protein